MSRFPVVLAAAAILWTACTVPSPAQVAPADPVSGSEESSPVLEPAPGALPDAFVPEDRSPFRKGLRRFEIVAFGSFPIMLFYANLGFDLSRYARSGYDPYYAPWPFKSEYSYKPSTPEILASVGTAALLSVGVGALDAVIRASRARRTGGPARVDSP